MAAENGTYNWLHVRLILEYFAGLWYNRCQKTQPFTIFQRERAAHTLSHSLCTSLSANCLQFIRLSIQPSRVGIVVGSDVGADDSCMGSGILTSSMLVSMIAGRRVWCRWGGRVLWCRAVEGFFPFKLDQ